jgi:hypothetical protein
MSFLSLFVKFNYTSLLYRLTILILVNLLVHLCANYSYLHFFIVFLPKFYQFKAHFFAQIFIRIPTNKN